MVPSTSSNLVSAFVRIEMKRFNEFLVVGIVLLRSGWFGKTSVDRYKGDLDGELSGSQGREKF